MPCGLSSLWRKKPLSGPGIAEPGLPVSDKPWTEILPTPAATAESLLFQRLPPEIRRLILIEAFGGRTMHIDITLHQPRFPVKFKNPGGRSPTKVIDTSKPRYWTWWGAVCGRVPHMLVDTDRGLVVVADQPAEDACCRPEWSPWTAVFSEAWPSPWPLGKISAHGWLLTCRQAYLEGASVLYGTNKIHLFRTSLCHALPCLFSPLALQAVTAIELVWDIAPLKGDDRTPFSFRTYVPGMVGFAALLDVLPLAFPNLISLDLALRGRLLPEGDEDTKLKGLETLLQMVDDMVGKLGRLKECTLGLPTTSFHVLRCDRIGVDMDWTLSPDRENHRLWREMPNNGGSGGGGVRGYWVCHGNVDHVGPLDKKGERPMGDYYPAEPSMSWMH